MSGKLIHRIAAAGACVLVAAGSCATASAFGHSYYLPDAAQMNITIPGELIAITRDASEGDSYFTTFHQDYAATMEDFKTNNIYLQGMDSSASLTLTVTMVESAESHSVVDYTQLSSEQLSEIAKTFLKDSAYTACRVDKSGKDVHWLQFDTSINGSKGLLANTVVDGKSVNVSMYRNGSDITEDDGKAFTNMTAGVRFGERNFFEQYGMMILVAIAAVLVVAVITMIIIRVVRSRGGERTALHDENEKILEELAGKYARKTVATAGDTKTVPAVTEDTAQPAAADSEEYAQAYDGEGDNEAAGNEEGYDEAAYDDEGDNEAAYDEEAYGEEAGAQPAQPQQGELLGAEDIEEFINDAQPAEEAPAEEAPAAQEQQAAAAQTAGADAEDKDDFFAGSDLATEEAYEIIETEAPVRAAEEMPAKEAPAEEIPVEEVSVEEAPETVTATEEPAEKSEEQAEEAEEAEAEEAEDEDETEDEEVEEEEEAEPDEFEEYMNDEVLVRQDVKSNKFRSSSDFFDEAPRKSIGVINSRDLVEAEEYDVIGEEEKRADEVKREEEPKKKKEKKGKGGFRMFLAGFLAGCKNFFTHCGYFITNVSRMIKRKRAIKKRKKAEEERRRRALQRSAEQRARAQNREAQREKQRTSGGLVQVRSRGERRPTSQSSQRRPSQSAQRRPSSSRPPQKRRPASSRPPQKRRPSSQSSQRRR